MSLFVVTECSHWLNKTDEIFKTPNFPDSHNHNQFCVWVIKGFEKVPTHITIEFLHFDIEEGHNCKFDSVVIYRRDIGGTKWSPVNGKANGLCGNQTGLRVSSFSGKLLVVFKTDYGNAKKGFKARYRIKQGKL